MGTSLSRQLALLRAENEQLRAELLFLRSFPTLLQGLKGESIVRHLTKGQAGTYRSKYDVRLPNKLEIEVKFSKLNVPVEGASTRRWNWSNPLGLKEGRQKEYTHLVLIGEKDPLHPTPIKDSSPYVFFLIPFQEIESVCQSRFINLSTNFARIRSVGGQKLLSFQCDERMVRDLLNIGG